MVSKFKGRPAQNIAHMQNYTDLVELVLSDRNIFLYSVIDGTNQYAREKHPNDDSWNPIPRNQEGIMIIKSFISVLIQYGLNGAKGGIANIWDQDETVGSTLVNTDISRDRWLQIKKYLCFNKWNDENDHLRGHPLQKFLRGLRMIQLASQFLVEKPLSFSIDEIRTHSKSRSDRFGSRNDSKPIRYGKDTHATSCAIQRHHGFMLDGLPACKEHTYDWSLDTNDEEGKMDNIVHQCIEKNCDCEDEIYTMDSRYMSVLVATDIASEYEIGVVGVINPTRKCLPKSLFKSKRFQQEVKRMKKGDTFQFVCDDRDESGRILVLTAWMDSKLVLLLDNCLNPFVLAPVVRRSPNGPGFETFDVPKVCSFYGEMMGEVDASSMHKVGYGIDIKHRRNHNRQMWMLFEQYVLINPALVLADNWNASDVSHKRLRYSLLIRWHREQRIYQREKNGRLYRKPKPITIEAQLNSTLASSRDGEAQHCLRKYRLNAKSDQVKCRQCGMKTTYVCTGCRPIKGYCNPNSQHGRQCFIQYHLRKIRPMIGGTFDDSSRIYSYSAPQTTQPQNTQTQSIQHRNPQLVINFGSDASASESTSGSTSENNDGSNDDNMSSDSDGNASSDASEHKMSDDSHSSSNEMSDDSESQSTSESSSQSLSESDGSNNGVVGVWAGRRLRKRRYDPN